MIKLGTALAGDQLVNQLIIPLSYRITNLEKTPKIGKWYVK